MSNKKNLILDIDQTLISAEPSEEFDFKKNKEKSKKFTFHDMDGYYIVFERPNLQKFLDFIFEHFNVSIWTAATKDYALYIIENVILKKKDRKIHYVFFSYHCDVSKHIKNGTKDLSVLWEVYKLPGFTQKNTLILDDYDEVHGTQPQNCILAAPFEFLEKNSENDKYFDSLIEHLKTHKDSDVTKLVKFAF